MYGRDPLFLVDNDPRWVQQLQHDRFFEAPDDHFDFFFYVLATKFR